MVVDSCPSCHSASVIFQRMVRNTESGDPFLISECEQCRLIFLTNIPDHLAPYYISQSGHIMSKPTNRLVNGLRNYLLGLDARPFLRSLSAGARILDFGCGDGNFSEVLIKNGQYVESADLYPKASWRYDHIKYHELSDLSSANELESVIVKGGIDGMVLRHVLEHLTQPGNFISLLAKKNIEALLVVVPNIESELRNFFGEYWCYWDPPRHLTFFSQKSLKHLFERRGYHAVYMDTYGLDEIVFSIERWLRLNQVPVLKRMAGAFAPRGILSSVSSALSYPFCSSVIRGVFVRDNRSSNF